MIKYDREYVSDEAVEKYDDARFAFLMEGLSAHLGEEYMAENRRLKEEEEPLPAAVDERCIKTIDAAIARRTRRRNAEKLKKVARRAAVAAASFLLIAALSTVVLYNTVEAFRLSIVDYAIELFDMGEGTLVSVQQNEQKNTVFKTPNSLPNGFENVFERIEADVAMIRYSNNVNTIVFTAHSDVSFGSTTIDTENAIDTYDIKVVGYSGIAVIKEGEHSLYWFEDSVAYCIWSDMDDMDMLIKIAESCYN